MVKQIQGVKANVFLRTRKKIESKDTFALGLGKNIVFPIDYISILRVLIFQILKHSFVTELVEIKLVLTVS